jgi:hypothetical protein
MIRRSLQDPFGRQSATCRCTSRRWPGAKKNVELVQLADNFMPFKWISVTKLRK